VSNLFIMKKARRKTKARIRAQGKRIRKWHTRKIMKRFGALLRAGNADDFNPFRRVHFVIPPPSLGRGWCKKCKASAICVVRPPTRIWRCKTCNQRIGSFPIPDVDFIWGIRRCPKRKAKDVVLCPRCDGRASGERHLAMFDESYY